MRTFQFEIEGDGPEVPVVNIVIPTVEGRDEYLARCLRGYRERTPPEYYPNVIIVEGAPTCGKAWQLGTQHAIQGDLPAYLHFTADDIVPGEGWLPPLIDCVIADYVPVAGVVTCTEEVLDPDDDHFPLPGNPRRESHFQLFEDHDRRWETPGLDAPASDSYYPSIPFCTMEQWKHIGPMIPSHYGTDKWFGERAKRADYWPVTTPESVFYHYVAQAGRVPKAEDWLHLDRLNFDLNIAYPEYAAGRLKPDETHPLDGTLEGRQMARDWYLNHVGEEYW